MVVVETNNVSTEIGNVSMEADNVPAGTENLFMGTELFQAERHLRQHIKMDINAVLSRSTMVEMEHMEIYFKPKGKYIEAFKTLQKLLELMKAVRHKKIDVSFLRPNSVYVEDEDFFNAINISTGELNLKKFLFCMHGTIKKKHIKKYVSDEALQAELLKVLEDYRSPSKDVRDPVFSYFNLDFLHESLINTIDKMNLTDCIIDKHGTAKIVVSIIQLGSERNLEALGNILGTLADKIEKIVYVDGRNFYEFTDRSVLDREYKVLKFDTTDDGLFIQDIRVPDFEEGHENFLTYREVSEEHIHTTSITIPLYDLDIKHHVKIMVNLKEECKQPLSTVFEFANIIKNAVEEERLNPADEENDYTEIINNTVFGALLYNFNSTQQILNNSYIAYWLQQNNRKYVLEEVFKNVSNSDIKGAVLGYDPDDENEKPLIMATEKIDTIYENNIYAGAWIFEADYKTVMYSELEALFKKIVSNIGVAGSEMFEITQL